MSLFDVEVLQSAFRDYDWVDWSLVVGLPIRVPKHCLLFWYTLPVVLSTNCRSYKQYEVQTI